MSEIKETLAHIEEVRKLIDKVIISLQDRADTHDMSKVESPEVEVFEKFTPLLKQSTYGSPEYFEMLDKMKVAISHHHKNNCHHPEYFENGIKDMNLIDIIEMFCDWKAATLRHTNGDIRQSIKINKKRFNYSEDLENIFYNTVSILE